MQKENHNKAETTEAAHNVLLRAFQTTFTGKPGAIRRESGQAFLGVSPSLATRIRFRNIVRMDRHDLVRSFREKQASLESFHPLAGQKEPYVVAQYFRDRRRQRKEVRAGRRVSGMVTASAMA